VHFFIPYMEEMLLNTFDMNAKLIVAKILLDEYGEDAGGKSHPELFRRFVRGCGGAEADASLLTTPLDPATISLVETHMQLCQNEPFLVSIGAIGEAHEFAIGFLFPPIVKGMQLAGFTPEDIEFFTLHVDHDVEHSQMLEDTMIRLALTAADCELIRRGTLASLAGRDALWSAMQRRMIAIDAGAEAPTTNRTLVDLTKGYKNVPETFWPA
jgi:pyrroloquinoline quinone (PQQ) biosynthesis protein C